MLKSLTFLIIVLSAAAAGAVTWDVRQDGLGDFTTIRAAIDAAQAGDEIVVWPGVWSEPALELETDLTLRSQAGAQATILESTGQKRLLQISFAAVTVSGFTIRGGSDVAGGGMLVENGGRATVTKCVFSGNRADETGGAILVRHVPSSLTVRDCSFAGNTAVLNGGAVAAETHAHCFIAGCDFRDNKSDAGGGALAASVGPVMIVRRCTFVGNRSPDAGALAFYFSSGFVQNNTFVGNISGLASVLADTDDSVLFLGNIVAGDAQGYGLAISRDQPRGCNIFFENVLGAMLGSPLDTSDREEDPLFCTAPTGELGLCADSPALARPGVCGVIGALDGACGPCGMVATETTNWGTLKAMFR